MRPTTSVAILLLFLLFKAQGIRLNQASVTQVYRKDHEKEGSLIKESGVEVVQCREGQCLGRSRRLLAETVSTLATSKNAKSGGVAVKAELSHEKLDKNREDFLVKSPISEHRQVASESYPDVVDIAGMDYAPARRKSPIHN